MVLRVKKRSRVRSGVRVNKAVVRAQYQKVSKAARSTVRARGLAPGRRLFGATDHDAVMSILRTSFWGSGR